MIFMLVIHAYRAVLVSAETKNPNISFSEKDRKQNTRVIALTSQCSFYEKYLEIDNIKTKGDIKHPFQFR